MPPRWKHKFELKPGCWVFVPDADTIDRGRHIKRRIESAWKPPAYYAHLHSGGHVAALQKHLQSDVFFRADINQFFNSINLTRVTRSLKNILKSYNNAREFATDSVVRDPGAQDTKYILPFGFVQSVIIASLALFESALGQYLDELTDDGFIVTVYVDDIIVSTNHPIERTQEAFLRLKERAERSRFAFSEHKTIEPGSEVTAFNLYLAKGSMRVLDERLDQFSSALSSSPSEEEINGILGYVRSICPEQADYLSSLLND